MFIKFFLLSLRNIRHRKLRSWLTIIGIIVGIALIVSLISLGRGLEQTILNQMQMFGSDLVMIMPGDENNPMLGVMGGGSLKEKELRLIQTTPGIDMAIPFDFTFITVEFKGEQKSTMIHASPMKETKDIYTGQRGFGVEKGYWPEREDTNEVLLGYKIAFSGFSEAVFIGDEIRIKGKRFKVAGILNEMGSSEDDNAVYMSMENMKKVTGNKASYRMIMAVVSEGTDPADVAPEIKFRLRKERGESSSFAVMTSAQTQKIVSGILGSVQLAVMFIALFAIVVGGIGVMNTMYTSVLERRREIGIMKAIGATRGDILNIFLIESAIIGLVGGVVGMGIGLGLAKLVEFGAIQAGFKFLVIYISFELIFGVILFALLLGVISGALPAREAAKLDPAVALRYE